jgi:hypothetical protein
MSASGSLRMFALGKNTLDRVKILAGKLVRVHEFY